ncbi:ABC transporter ATP-binding protein [Parapedobacter sp. ISTM3]|uniref:ABC-2 type transport system ATP-binding protein n=1 Tax=Parapedobacter luteus TaxID=623280 RepID=A0A1T5AM20_9SPHI|nr:MULTISPECIES: ABC transporter ATP-binding protein [Parapedobacter]MBK1441683.1 ABC transporter ATP-binding protein [Parapedobacter sp. ISTM3]SKB36006.1 ABC-2 type transport system ATP-binding protein [Parapedobacter luteus]
MNVQVRQLTKSFGVNPVLAGIDLDFVGGHVYGIVGQNGAGKTTLFNCLAGLEAHGGTVTTEGGRLKDRLGFLQTEPFMLSRMTGREYLRLCCKARGVPDGDLDARNVFDLPLDRYAQQYSTGMKKKLALQAILLQPNDVFILDEPYNGVDIHSALLITEIIHRLRASGKVILISSHIFSTLKDTCDVIHVLDSGKMAKTVEKADFNRLEQAMTDFAVGNKLDALPLG